uniref:Uncharacterized protein n=1 Tax=Hyaloperonospora arabidopsidis (strain Emoy2) TaxID=559515 RepID=M4BDH1_HYAAE
MVSHEFDAQVGGLRNEALETTQKRSGETQKQGSWAGRTCEDWCTCGGGVS